MFKHTKHHTDFSRTWLARLEENVPEKRVIKSSHATESYQRHKLARSVHKACMDATGYIGEAELTAENVCREVEQWLERKYEVTTADIRRQTAQILKRYNPTAAYEYEPTKENQIQRDDYGFIRL